MLWNTMREIEVGAWYARNFSWNDLYGEHLTKFERRKKAIYKFLEDLLNEWLSDVSLIREFLLILILKKRKKETETIIKRPYSYFTRRNLLYLVHTGKKG